MPDEGNRAVKGSFDRRLIRVGGSICVPIPTSFRRELKLIPGVTVRLSMDEKGFIRLSKVRDGVSDSVEYR